MRARPVDKLAEAAYEAHKRALHAGVQTHARRWDELDETTRRIWCNTIDVVMTAWLNMPRPQSAYYDPREAVRLCDHCEQTYRGPAVYCCHACALDDAGEKP